jgi:hypothetical protein
MVPGGRGPKKKRVLKKYHANQASVVSLHENAVVIHPIE